ncbi:MAG: 30S ribosomal protein THX [Altibacter sp.]|nr:30S ribosomal protein THX [Altibacter sp.]MBZ0326781.1 30S ribosomal protein THX [Altibacter sp.]
MGKGDKKTRRGKIVLGTFGKLRPRRKKFSLRSQTLKGKPKDS